MHYARDAFEGLSLMDRVMTAKRGGAPVVDPEREAALAARRARRERQRTVVTESLPELHDSSVRSDVAADVPVPAAPFLGTRVIKGVPMADYAALLDERATFLGQWGLRGARGGGGPSYEELVETEGRPRLRYWLDRLIADQVLEAAVVYGYFPAYSEGNDLVVLDENGHAERARFSFPASGRSGGSASRTSSGPRATSSMLSRCNWSPSASRSVSTRRSCSPATSTATTWRCTGSPCSSRRPWRNTGTGASAPS
ncbi:hypothetical protein GCM10027614_14230 [Micromonospora vulcania]